MHHCPALDIFEYSGSLLYELQKHLKSQKIQAPKLILTEILLYITDIK